MPSESCSSQADMRMSDRKGAHRTILSLGSINADFQMRVERRPEVSETVLAHDFVRLGGGKAANVAFLARRLGCDARLFARVGQDDLADQALRPLRDAGVDLSGVTGVEGADTAVSIVSVPPDGKKGIVLAPGANAAWRAEDADEVAKAVTDAPGDNVLVLDCEVPTFVVEAAIRAAREHGIATVLDPSPADRVTDIILAHSDVVLPNPVEAESLSGIEVSDTETATRAGRAILARGARAACMKLSDGGCVIVEDGAPCRVLNPPHPEVVDTTGAGDAFAGALGVALAEGRILHEAAVLAAAAATHTVTGYGSQPAYPDRNDIERIAERVTVTSLDNG